MPKRYEEEINEILHKFDDWPPPDDRGRARHSPPRREPALASLGSWFARLGPEQLMALGLVCILGGVVLRFSYRWFVLGPSVGTYATVLGVLALLGGYILAVARGAGAGPRRGQHVWRGQVIDLRPGNRGLGYWWWRMRANRRNGRRR